MADQGRQCCCFAGVGDAGERTMDRCSRKMKQGEVEVRIGCSKEQKEGEAERSSYSF